MVEYVYFLKDASEPFMKVGSSEKPLAEAKSLSSKIDLQESRVIAFEDKDMADAVVEELRHLLKSFEKGEGTGWYSTEAKDELLEQAKHLGLKVDPLLG